MTLNPYYRGEPTDHFDGLRFFNPNEPDTDRGLMDILRWQWTAVRAKWPSEKPVNAIKPDPQTDHLRVTLVGHATVLIQLAGLNILTDPVWSERASPLPFAGPRRANRPGIALADLPPIHAVFLSHNHYDHLDVATLKRLCARHDPLIITPLGNDTIVRRHIPTAKLRTGDWGDCLKISETAEVFITPALHWSSRGARDRRMALWGGFILRAAGKQIYFAGDTGYGSGRIFRDIFDRYGPTDVALIPIGAYEPRWFMSAQHVDPDEAIQIMLDIEATKALGIHWGTFRLTDEPRDEPFTRLRAGLRKRKIPAGRFTAMQPGDAFDALPME